MSLDNTGGVGFLLNVAVKNAVRYVSSLVSRGVHYRGNLRCLHNVNYFVIDKELYKVKARRVFLVTFVLRCLQSYSILKVF